jgi:hypothetical protein
VSVRVRARCHARARACVCVCVRARACVCVPTCLCVQIGGPTNGELTIARVNAAGGQIIECGKDGMCMFHSFLVGAILKTLQWSLR